MTRFARESSPWRAGIPAPGDRGGAALGVGAIAALVIAFVAGGATPAAALSVAGHTPAAYELAVSAASGIAVVFDQPLDAGSIHSGTVIVRGQLSGVHAAVLGVDGNTLTIDPIEDFMIGEIVTVGLTSGVASQGEGATLTNGYVFQFTIDVLGGTLDFVEHNRSSTAPAITPYFLYGGDLDGNGYPDAVAPNEGTNDVSVFLNDGDAVFDAHIDYGVGAVPSSCYGDDFNNDGVIDIATANIASDNMTVLLGAGGGVLVPSLTYPGGDACRQVYGGDLDGDGDVDLVTTGFNDDTITIHTNDGAGIFSQSVMNVSSGPFPVFVGDMNLDGLPDIVVGFQGIPRRIQIFDNQGGGVFAPGASTGAGSGGWDLFGNDMDGDGDLDVVLAEAHVGRFHLFRGDGNGGFEGGLQVATGSFPLGIYLADLDDDDDLDVITSNFSSRDIRVHRNDGAAFPQVQDIDLIQSGSFAWAHDLDLDGDLDLTSVDELADFIFVHLNQGNPAAVGEPGAPPLRLALRPPFPNPAAHRVEMDLEVPAGLGPVTLDVYDARGRLVRRLLDRRAIGAEAGRIAWDLRSGAGRAVAAGVYLLRLRGGGSEASGRVLIAR